MTDRHWEHFPHAADVGVRGVGWLAEGRRVHVYFDNDAEGAAPRDAMRLMAMAETLPA